MAVVPGAAMAAPRGVLAEPPAGGSPIPGELLVGFEPDTKGSDRAEARRAAGVTARRGLLGGGVQLVVLAQGESAGAAIARLERDPSVRYAEPNRRRTTQATVPNDASFGQLWGLDNTGQTAGGVTGTADSDVDAPEAWDVFKGANTLVAVVDEGIAYDHPDLASNVWTNPGEVAGNGVDDDGNGFPDDIHGFDFADGDADPRDLGGHGTHVAGTIAAVGDNGIGVAGVSWTARLMAVRALGPDGGSDADIADAFDYAAENGARVVNASLGGPGSSTTLTNAVNRHPTVLYVVAAGNDGTNNDLGSGTSPCNITAANLICVAATDQNDGLASFSNFGSTSVDLGAPGTNILSTLPSHSRVIMSDGFEANDFATRWDAHGNLVTKWTRTTTSAATGGASITDSAGAGVNYGNNVLSYADLRTGVNLSGEHGCVVTFKAKLNVLAGDKFRVDRAIGAGSFTGVGVVDGGADTGGTYRSFTFDLDADGATSVRIGFGLETNASGVADGANVDDLFVRCIGPQSGPPEFGLNNGTSMATPQVAGAAALVLGHKPSLTVPQLRSILLSTGDQRASLAGKTVTGRRLNVNNAIRDPLAAPSPSPSPSPSPTADPDPDPTPTASPTATPTATPTGGGSTTAPPGGGTPTTTQPEPAAGGGSANPTARGPSLSTLAKRARVTCARVGGAFRCRVTRAGTPTLKLTIKRGKRLIATGRGRAGKRITLSGGPVKAGRYTVVVTLMENGEKAPAKRTVRIR